MTKEICDIICSIYSKYLLPRPLTESAAIDMHSVGDIGYYARAQNWPRSCDVIYQTDVRKKSILFCLHRIESGIGDKEQNCES